MVRMRGIQRCSGLAWAPLQTYLCGVRHIFVVLLVCPKVDKVVLCAGWPSRQPAEGKRQTPVIDAVAEGAACAPGTLFLYIAGDALQQNFEVLLRQSALRTLGWRSVPVARRAPPQLCSLWPAAKHQVHFATLAQQSTGL